MDDNSNNQQQPPTKNPEQLHIVELYEAYNNDHRPTHSLANLLNSVIHTGLSGSLKFLFELIQNADDAEIQEKIAGVQPLPITMEFIYQPPYFIIRHNGKLFDKNDVEKIADVAALPKQEKSNDPTKTGCKGLGFKALFSISDFVAIFSDKYHFRFDKSVWPTPALRPWQVIPVWSEKSDLPKETIPHIKNGSVNIVLKLNPGVSLEEEFTYLEQNPHVLLFLRRVNRIKVTNKQKEFTLSQTIHKIPNTSFIQKEFYIDEKSVSSWIVSDIPCEIPKPVTTQLQKLEDSICPKRIKNASRTTLRYAARLENGNLVESKDCLLFATLPSRELCGLPFIVNAEFLLNPDRTQLNENIWNIFLLEQVAFHQFVWLRQLAEYTVTRTSVLNILPGSTINLFWNGLKNAYALGFKNGAGATAWIPAHSPENPFLKLGRCIVDMTNFFQQFQVTDNITAQLVTYDLTNLTKLYQLGFAEVFDDPKLLVKLNDFIKNSKEKEFNYRVLQFLYEMWKKNKQLDAELKKTRCLLTLSGKVATPNPEDAYLPTQDNEVIPAVFGIDVVRREVIGDDKQLLLWLKKNLGAREASRIDIIQTKIFGWIKNGEIALKNNIDNIAILRFVFLAFKTGQLTDDDFKTLKDIKLLAQNGQLVVPRECYLADIYEPEVKLESNGLPPSFFVYAGYCENATELPQWRQFLVRLGVAPVVQLRFKPWYRRGDTISENGRILKEYFEYLKAHEKCPKTMGGNVDEHKLKNFVDINFIQHLENPAYSIIFWRLVIQDWAGLERCAEDTAYHSTKDVYIITPFLSYYLSTKRCILASDGYLYTSTQLYSPHLNEVLNGVFPIVTIPERITEKQAKYFGFKIQLSVDHILLLLEHFKKFPERAKPRHYEVIFTHILQLNMNDKEKIKARRDSIFLLAESGTLQPVTKLNYYESEQFKSPPDSTDYLRLLPGFRHDQMLDFCRIFGIHLITGHKAEPIFDRGDAIEEDSLQEFFRTKLPLIALLEARSCTENPEVVIVELLSLLRQLKSFSVKSLAVKYPSQQTPTNETHFLDFDTRTLYYTGRWSKSSAKHIILGDVVRYLGIKSDIREILKIKADHEISSWLERRFFKKEKYSELKEIAKATTKAVVDTDAVNSSLDNTLSSQRETSVSDSVDESNVENLLLDTPKSGSKQPITPSTKPDVPDSPFSMPTPLFTVPPKATTDKSSPKDVTPHLIRKPAKPSVTTHDQAPRFQPECPPDDAKLSQTGFFKVTLQTPPNKTTKTSTAGSVSGTGTVTPKNKLSDSDKTKIGEWSENFVYKKVMLERYKIKYSTAEQEATIQETDNGFTLKGFKKSNDGTNTLEPVNIEVVWFNKKGETYKPVDFMIRRNGKEKYIEVKGTKSSDKRSFEISAKEAAFMNETKDKYRIYRLFNAGKKGDVRVEKIKNPGAEIDSGLIEMSPATYKMKYWFKK